MAGWTRHCSQLVARPCSGGLFHRYAFVRMPAGLEHQNPECRRLLVEESLGGHLSCQLPSRLEGTSGSLIVGLLSHLKPSTSSL